MLGFEASRTRTRTTGSIEAKIRREHVPSSGEHDPGTVTILRCDLSAGKYFAGGQLAVFQGGPF
jgi:hypothetical protein